MTAVNKSLANSQERPVAAWVMDPSLEGVRMPKERTPGPSVKDPELYEALREDGASKEKAARIANAAANTSRSEVGRKGGKSKDYEDQTVRQLRARARDLEIPGRSTMKKSELIHALRNH